MPLSSDPEARAKQLQNLRRGGTNPGGGRPPEHGGYSAIARELLAAQEREVLDVLAQSAPVKAADGTVPAADQIVVVLFSEALIRLRSVKAAIDARLWGEVRGHLGNAVQIEARLRRECLRYAEQLGMTPMARRRLGLPVTPEPPRDSTGEEDAAAARRRLDQRLAAIDGGAEEVAT